MNKRWAISVLKISLKVSTIVHYRWLLHLHRCTLESTLCTSAERQVTAARMCLTICCFCPAHKLFEHAISYGDLASPTYFTCCIPGLRGHPWNPWAHLTKYYLPSKYFRCQTLLNLVPLHVSLSIWMEWSVFTLFKTDQGWHRRQHNQSNLFHKKKSVFISFSLKVFKSAHFCKPEVNFELPWKCWQLLFPHRKKTYQISKQNYRNHLLQLICFISLPLFLFPPIQNVPSRQTSSKK